MMIKATMIIQMNLSGYRISLSSRRAVEVFDWKKQKKILERREEIDGKSFEYDTNQHTHTRGRLHSLRMTLKYFFPFERN